MSDPNRPITTRACGLNRRFSLLPIWSSVAIAVCVVFAWNLTRPPPSEIQRRIMFRGVSAREAIADPEMAGLIAESPKPMAFPTSAEGIWMLKPSFFSLDEDYQIVFRVDPEQIAGFVEVFSGKHLDELATTSSTFFVERDGGALRGEGFPWNIQSISNGRYDESSWPVMAVDVDRSIVYIRR